MSYNVQTTRYTSQHTDNLEFDEEAKAKRVVVASMPPIEISQPVDYPLPADQVTTLTPPAAITGFATSAKQDSQITLETTLNSLTETLQELVQRLAPLAGAMSNTAQLRTVVTGAVTATGGGYITSAQHIANTLTQTNSLQYNPNNTLAIQSNINNCVVT